MSKSRRVAWLVLNSLPLASRQTLYLFAQKLRGYTSRTLRLILQPRYTLRTLLTKSRPKASISTGFDSRLLVLLEDGSSLLNSGLLPLNPDVVLCRLPSGPPDLYFVRRQAQLSDARYILFLANPDLLSLDFLQALARTVSQNPGFVAWLSGSVPGFWSWDFSGFCFDPEAILLIRTSMLDRQEREPRTRRNASTLSVLQSQLLFNSSSRHVLTELQPPSRPVLSGFVSTLPLALPRVHPSASEQRLVVVIPTRDRSDLLMQAITGLQQQRLSCPLDLVVVDNASEQPETEAVFNQLSIDSHSFTLLRYPHPFNFSALCNLGIAASSASFVLLLNNDVVFTSSDSLSAMLDLASLETVGCVGALLRYPDGKLQHIGVELTGELVQHQLHGISLPSGYFSQRCRQVSAVTGACVMFKRSLWLELGGLDEQLPVDFNDIDFCLRAQSAGFANLITPSAKAHHIESASRGSEVHSSFHQSLQLMKARWGKHVGNDPFAIS